MPLAAPLNVPDIILHAFPGIQPVEAEQLAQTGALRTYPSAKILCQEDALETVFYILLEGEVKVSKTINSSEVRLLKVLKVGDFFGEMALIHNAPRAATVETLTPVTVLEIDKAGFETLLERNSVVSLAMVKEVSRRLRENDQMAIDDLRLKAGELAAAYEQLAEEEYARSEFLSRIAHELRTPLTAANGYLQMIRAGRLQGDMLQMAVEAMSRNLQEIITQVNDILFMQELDMILPEAREVDLAAVIAAAVEKQRSRAQQVKVRISASIPPDLPPVLGDPESLERAFAAILDNAVKFSPNGGGVQVDACPEQGQVKVVISDQGVGIPSDQLNRIFNRFFHLDEVEGRLFRGVGLGLSIARQVIEQQGGAIEVSSSLGAGSTFTVRLKVA
jgi:signal transduction histidine kinase